MERWKRIKRFPDYQVSSEGRVRRLTRAKGTKPFRVLTPQEFGSGNYLAVRLMPHKTGSDRRMRKCYVHVLVAAEFIGPPPSDKHDVNHMDCDTQNNRVDNLEYMTRAENIQHAIAMGVKYVFPSGDAHPMSRISDDSVSKLRALARRKVPTKELAEMFHLSPGHVRKIVRGVIR